MNKRNPALDCYIDALRVCNALRQFRKTQRLSKFMWDKLISPDTQLLLSANFFVRIEKYDVFLTEDGLFMLESTLAGG